MNKRMAVLVGVLIVGAVVAFIAMRGYPPTGNTSGAIGAAQRYTGQPMKDADVQLTSAEAQTFLQSDLFHKMATNAAFRQEVKNGDIGKLYGTPAFARLMSDNHAFADMLVRGDFVKAMQDGHMASLMRDPAMAHFVTDPAFVSLLADAGFRDLVGARAIVVSNAKDVVEGAKGRIDGTKGQIEGAKGQVTDAQKSAVDASKNMTDAQKSAVDASKNVTDAQKNAVDASHGATEAAKTQIDASKNAVDQAMTDASRLSVDQLRIDAARYKGDAARLNQARAELQRLSADASFRSLVASDGFGKFLTSADGAAIMKDAHIVEALRGTEYQNLIANDQSRTDLAAVMSSDALRGAVANASFTDMLKIDGARDFLVSDGFRGTAARYSADLAQVVDGYKVSE